MANLTRGSILAMPTVPFLPAHVNDVMKQTFGSTTMPEPKWQIFRVG